MHSNVNGLLLIDKPTGPSSYDIIRKIQKFLPKVKIGHGGTLDPLASGLLILGLGPSTKSLTKLLQFPKTYFATIRLGYATDTDDSLGNRIPLDTLNVAKEQQNLDTIHNLQPISVSVPRDRINLALKQFLGPQMQVPPQFSAKLVNGKRAYALARAGAHIELDPKEITIYDIKLLNILSTSDEGALADIQIELTCSSGTYVRALARDLGNQLGTSAHITQLRRTKIGNYSVTEAVDAENFILSDIITNKIEKNHSPNNLNAIVKEMKTVNTFYESVTCIGKFDGVHIGHQKMLSTVAKTAKSRGLSSIAIVLETGISRSFSDNNT
ncbi:MAG: tRNA pseudouridine(55) synthase TruB, partial [Bifidobacteriaceae bacterium]|nr:tRNA pseudouridine(55) synthase TruB [Bifidobacteriaceae bacterium]